MREMNKNTMKAIKHRQRGTDGHRGAFWSRGRATAEDGRRTECDYGILERSPVLKYTSTHSKPLPIVTSDRRKRGILERAKTALTVCPFFVAVEIEARGKREKVRTLRPSKSSSMRGKCEGIFFNAWNMHGATSTTKQRRNNAENGIKRRSYYPTGNEGRTEEGHTGADEARAKQAKAKKTSVRCVLEQRESKSRGRTAQKGIFRRTEGGFLIR